jgi:hypothetical protein
MDPLCFKHFARAMRSRRLLRPRGLLRAGIGSNLAPPASMTYATNISWYAFAVLIALTAATRGHHAGVACFGPVFASSSSTAAHILFTRESLTRARGRGFLPPLAALAASTSCDVDAAGAAILAG